MENKNIGTHNGKFHADEAFACALLSMTKEFANAKITRTRDEAILATMDIVVDVGGVYDPAHHRYDHHQPSFKDTFSPSHQTLLSSAGLIYKHFAKEIIAKQITSEEDVAILYRKLYDTFVEPFDAHDNGISAYPDEIKPRFHRSWDLFSQVNILNPAWNETGVNSDERFAEAVALVRSNWERILNYYCRSWLPGRNSMRRIILKQAAPSTTIIDPRILVLDEFCSWTEFLLEYEEETGTTGNCLYVIFEDSTGSSWRVSAVPVALDSFKSRQPLPETWRGLRDAELDAVVGITGCVFVHRAGFIGAHRTREGAIQMATRALATDRKAN